MYRYTDIYLCPSNKPKRIVNLTKIIPPCPKIGLHGNIFHPNQGQQ